MYFIIFICIFSVSNSFYFIQDTVEFAAAVEEMMRTTLGVPLDEAVEEEVELPVEEKEEAIEEEVGYNSNIYCNVGLILQT